MYAIIEDSGTQFKVEEGQVLDLHRKSDVDESITFEAPTVKALHDGTTLHVSPEKAVVTASVLGESKGPKLIVMKFRRRKNSKTRNGYRSKLTRVRIDKIALEG